MGKTTERLSPSQLSARIRAGIRRAKRAGKTVGTNGYVLAERHRTEAAARAERLRPIAEEFHLSGVSYREMVMRLNARGTSTPSGSGRWHVKTLQRLVARLATLRPALTGGGA